jgi:16S rRNA (cytosine967-C5)-methyltransferase
MAAGSSRQVALIALRQWQQNGGFADAILAQLLDSTDLTGPDRAFVTELFYGVLRNLTLLDSWIDALRPRHLDRSLRDLLRLGLYQLFLLETSEHAAVYETVECAPTRGRSLVNAVLRNAIRDKRALRAEAEKQALSIRYSQPQFLIDRWTTHFGTASTMALCEWNNRPALIFARINHLKISGQEFLAKYHNAKAVLQHENFVHFTNLQREALTAGNCYIQDPSTAAACILLAPIAGEKVLDACAAPGGKTGYIAELMKNQGTIVACDRDAARIKVLGDNLRRLGIVNTELVQHDWTSGDQLHASLAGAGFDRILVDAPCSNTGVLRRRVDLRWRLSPADFGRMQGEQLRILRRTIPLLKERGVLVYSTCSIEPEENEQVIEMITKEFSGLKVVDQMTILPFRDKFDGAFATALERTAR